MLANRFTLRSAVFACMLLLAVSAVGQVITGVIVGTVRDESGAVLPGATVTLSSDQLPGGPEVAITNDKGQYRFPNLPPGTYNLMVEMPGFGTYNEEGLQVRVGGNTERNVVMGLASVAETITVTGESPVVDTRKSGVSTNYSNEYMENTPLRRFSFFDFTKAAPGMSATNPTSGTSNRVSAFGSSVDENAYLMDGTDFTAPVSGAAWPWPDTDVIEEIEIISLGASAEYGNMTGAVFNVVTKQGTNDFKADAAYFGMWDALTSKPIKEDCNCPEGETGFTRDIFRDFTVHAGAPIVRDKAWIYGGFQYQRDYDNQPGTDPRFPRKFEADRIYWKFTWQINDDIKFMHTYHDDYWVIPSTPSVSRPFETINTFSGRNPSVTFGNVTHVLSPNTFYDVRVSGFYSPNDLGENNNPGVSGRTDFATGVREGGAPFSGGFRQARTAVNGKLSHYATDFLGGDHDFKFGVQFVDGSHSGHYGYTNGVIYYDYYGDQYYAYLRDRYNYGGQFKNVGLFAEDMVTLGDKVTLQLGLRYDRQEAISQDIDFLDQNLESVGTVTGAGTLYTWNNISPRFGFNIKVDDAARTVIRGNWGRYFRGVITGEIAQIHPGWSELTVATFAPPPGMEAACQERRFDGSLIGCYTNVIFTENPIDNLAVDPDTQGPRTDQFSIGLDHELSNNTAISFTYIRKDQTDLIGWNVLNAQYGRQTVTLEGGQQLEVFPILTDPSDRIFQTGNRDDFFMDYNGVLLSFNKRWSNNWQALVSYTWSEAIGLLPSNAFDPGTSQTSRVFGTSIGKDPNDVTNATGNLLNDRTHMFRVQGATNLPGDILLGANFQYFTGKPWAAQARVPAAVVSPADFSLPQGSRDIYIEPLGTRRLEDQFALDFRVSKVFRFGETGKVEILADVLNLLNDTSTEDVITRNYLSGNFGVGSLWIDPRRAMIGVKFGF